MSAEDKLLDGVLKACEAVLLSQANIFESRAAEYPLTQTKPR